MNIAYIRVFPRTPHRARSESCQTSPGIPALRLTQATSHAAAVRRGYRHILAIQAPVSSPAFASRSERSHARRRRFCSASKRSFSHSRTASSSFVHRTPGAHASHDSDTPSTAHLLSAHVLDVTTGHSQTPQGDTAVIYECASGTGASARHSTPSAQVDRRVARGRPLALNSGPPTHVPNRALQRYTTPARPYRLARRGHQCARLVFGSPLASHPALGRGSTPSTAPSSCKHTEDIAGVRRPAAVQSTAGSRRAIRPRGPWRRRTPCRVPCHPRSIVARQRLASAVRDRHAVPPTPAPLQANALRRLPRRRRAAVHQPTPTTVVCTSYVRSPPAHTHPQRAGLPATIPDGPSVACKIENAPRRTETRCVTGECQ
ncbi:hypothetical protein C8Q77DRAFT_1121419 [Trametes polyzona]|nr:hypothetical protein C8Q77DRAFT_1121419 [Trametes polyzona]